MLGLPEGDEVNPADLLWDCCGTPRYMAQEARLKRGYSVEADRSQHKLNASSNCILFVTLYKLTDPQPNGLVISSCPLSPGPFPLHSFVYLLAQLKPSLLSPLG